MGDANIAESSENANLGSYHALLVAFQTMKERCQQLQTRLATVEEENVCLRLECGKDMSMAIVKIDDSKEKTILDSLQENVEKLKKQKSQLTHHIFMVAAENRQLWSRLTKLTKTNKSLDSQLTQISHTLKQHSTTQPSDILSHSFQEAFNVTAEEAHKQYLLPVDNGDGGQSLEEISLRIINRIKLEKSELEQQCVEMVELQNSSGLKVQNIGFTYPEDSDIDSLEQLKQHDVRLLHTKDALLLQQTRLKRAIQNLKKMKKEITCNGCRKNANKKMCQAGTQFGSDDSFREHGATQTSLLPLNLSLEKCSTSPDNFEKDNKICPLCGNLYGKFVTFADFHEHVLNHFTND